MTTIEIKALRVRKALAPVRRTLATRVGTFTKAPFLLLDLELKGGGVGHALCFTFIPAAQKVVPLLLEEIVATVKGRSIGAEDLSEIHDLGQRKLTHLGHEGAAMMALSMFDMVLHDAMARACGLPLYKMLGAKPVALATYNSCGLGLMSPAEVAREARELAAEHGGFKHVKLRMGRGDVKAEIEAYRAAREAVGHDVAISCDFNQGLPSVSALETCRAIDGLGLAWIEEPVVYDDYETQARLATKLATPVNVGENWWSWRVGKAAIEMGACDYIMPDLLRIGGVTGWMRLAKAAEQRAVPFSSHLSPDFSAHVLAATPTRHWLEFMDWGQDLLSDPLLPVKGFTTPRDAPGTGIAWNEAAIAKCLLPD